MRPVGAAAAALVVGVVALGFPIASGGLADRVPVQDPGAAERGVDAATAAMLDARAAALRRGDLDGWLAAVDPAATNFRAQQAAVFGRLRNLPVVSWRYQV